MRNCGGMVCVALISPRTGGLIEGWGMPHMAAISEEPNQRLVVIENLFGILSQQDFALMDLVSRSLIVVSADGGLNMYSYSQNPGFKEHGVNEIRMQLPKVFANPFMKMIMSISERG